MVTGRAGQGRGRRALRIPSEHAGTTHVRGDPPAAALLAAALKAAAGPPELELTHGFHTYPARMHPLTARRLVGATPSGAVILDPFAGSGTVLVEALLAGRAAIGVDCNPLAVRLARVKTGRWSTEALRRLVDRASDIGRRAFGRAESSRGVPLPGFDPRMFGPHVYRELYFLRTEIERDSDPRARETLLMVLSAIIVKFSNLRGDTSAETTIKRIAAGLPSRHFARKAMELARGLDDLSRAVPAGTPDVQVLEGDARDLPLGPASRVDRVITSPPYPGVYDYTAHHALRMRLLGIGSERFEQIEMGARRHGARALDRWRKDLGLVLSQIARRLNVSGAALFLIGDGIATGKRVVGDQSLEEAALACGLRVHAAAWQPRPALSALERKVLGPRKNEYLIELRSSGA